jgi:DNA-binding CsgD family transcriptional regulator
VVELRGIVSVSTWRAGRQAAEIAEQLGVAGRTIYNWRV